MSHFLALLLGLVLAGCSQAQPSPKPGVIIPAATIRRATLAAMPKAIVIQPDATYNAPQRAWIDGAFNQYYLNDSNDKGLTGYRTNGRDCDKFASLYRVDAQACFDVSLPNAEGFAVGELYYTRDTGVKHAINLIYTDGTISYIEPQTCAFVTLSDSELRSVWFVHW